MRCFRCESELSESARFCGRCGIVVSPGHSDRPSIGHEPAPRVLEPATPRSSQGSSPERSAGVLLLEAPVASRPVRVEPVEEVIPAIASAATTPLREERAERVEGPRWPSRTGVAALAGALLVGGALGLFVGHRTNGGAAAEVVRLQTGLADA